MSLRWRIAAALGMVGLVVAVAASIGAYLATEHEIRSSLDAALASQTGDVADGPEEGGRIDGRTGCPPDALLRPADAAQLVKESGAVEVCLPDGPLLSAPDPLPVDGEVTLSSVEIDGTTFRVAAAPYHGGGTLLIGRDEAEIESVLASLRTRLALLTALVATVAGAAGWFVARRLVRPVVRLGDAARSIAESGDLTTEIPVGGSAEVGDLTKSFTTMVQALATSREQQRRLIADAGHELRTPLTSLTTNIELLDRLDELPEAERREVLAAVHAEVTELTELAVELVDLASDRSSDEPVQAVVLADIAERAIERTRRRSGRPIELVVDGDGLIEARPQMLERCISNVLQNAVKYTPAETPIEVHVSDATVEVLDRGPGVPPEDLERVFDRFYRSDSARSVPGSGLGLAIVAQAIHLHGGDVWARNREGGGAAVGFGLPVGSGVVQRDEPHRVASD